MKHSLRKLDTADLDSSKPERILDEIALEMEAYVSQLLWWNERVNLVSRDVSRETIHHHLLHSLLLVPLLQLEPKAQHSPILDAGSGGGLPGFVLAMAMPERRFILNDIQSKKCIAIDQMARTLKTENISVWCGDIAGADINRLWVEHLNRTAQPQTTPPRTFTVVSKHAFKLDDILFRLKGKPWDRILMLKGLEDIHKEYADCMERTWGRAEELDALYIDLQEWTKQDIFSGKGLVMIHNPA